MKILIPVALAVSVIFIVLLGAIIHSTNRGSKAYSATSDVASNTAAPSDSTVTASLPEDKPVQPEASVSEAPSANANLSDPSPFPSTESSASSTIAASSDKPEKTISVSGANQPTADAPPGQPPGGPPPDDDDMGPPPGPPPAGTGPPIGPPPF